MTQYSFSRFVYIDTNIISVLCKDESLWPSLFDFLRDNGLTLGIGMGQVAELADAKRLHQQVARFLISVPTGVVKNLNEIVDEEVQAHPRNRTSSILMYPLNAILLEERGFERLIQFLSSRPLLEAREEQLRHAQQMSGRHARLKRNFPPNSSGSYSRNQADKFAEMMVVQWLSQTHRGFLEQFRDDIEGFHSEVFLSIRLYALVIFYKYYLGRREPKRLSDFGDFFHLFPIPYCEIAIIERDLCETLNQVKRNHTILDSTDIENIDFLKRFSPTSSKGMV